MMVLYLDKSGAIVNTPRVTNQFDQLWQAISQIHSRLAKLETRNEISDKECLRAHSIHLTYQVYGRHLQSVSLAQASNNALDHALERTDERVHLLSNDFTRQTAENSNERTETDSNAPLCEQKDSASQRKPNYNKRHRRFGLHADEAQADSTEGNHGQGPAIANNLQEQEISLKVAELCEEVLALSSTKADGSELGEGSQSSIANESIENKIGLYWLSRLGIGFLVVGAALLVVYSFPFFGAWAKLLTGFLIAGSLLLAGKHMDSKQKMTWLGNAFAGGGWSLAYFCSYAMHNVASVRVIEDPTLGTLAMLAVAAGSTIHSIKKNSELIGSFSTILGFAALSLSEMNSFTTLAFSILSANFALLSRRKQWLGLYNTGLICAGGFILANVQQGMADFSTLTTLEYLLPFWVASAAMPFVFKDMECARGSTVAANICTAMVSFLAVSRALASEHIHALESVYLFGAGLYTSTALLYKHFKLKEESLSSAMLALSSLTLYVPAAHLGPHNVIMWSIQLALILWAGFKYNIRSFRWFAYPLSIVTFIASLVEFFDNSTFMFNGAALHWTTINILPALAVFAVASIASHEKHSDCVSEGTHEFNFYWYLHMFGVVAITWVPFIPSALNDTSMGTTIAGWTALAGIAAYMGLCWRRNYVLILSLLTYVLAISLAFAGPTVPAVVFPSVALILSLFVVSEHFRANNTGDAFTKNYQNVYFILGTLSLFQIQSMHLHSLAQTCLMLVIEMFAFIAIGIHRKDKCVRGCGVLAAFVLNLVLLFNEATIGLPTMCASVLSLFAAAQVYMKVDAEEISLAARNFVRHVLTCGATFTMVHFSGTQLDPHFISLAWAAEGISLITAGFVLRDQLLRIAGLIVFGLMALHLLFVDLASAATIYRIVAFMVAGLFLMAAAYTYNYFNKKLCAEEKSKLLPQDQLHLSTKIS